jgi:DNA-binding transcriptional regulator GbsR (MarR family)
MTELAPIKEKFILHWGEMGNTWGINRTVAQIYAMLYLSPEPMTAEEISETLSIARSTVSTGLHELQGWGVVRVVHVLGDRRDHYEALDDVWEMFRVILEGRKRREIDPTLAMLRESEAELKQKEDHDPYLEQRLQEMLDFFEMITVLYEQFQELPTETCKKMVRMGDTLAVLMKRVSQNKELV